MQAWVRTQNTLVLVREVAVHPECNCKRAGDMQEDDMILIMMGMAVFLMVRDREKVVNYRNYDHDHM